GEPVLIRGKVSFPVTDEPEEEREPTMFVDAVEPLSDAVLSATHRMTVRLEVDSVNRKQLEMMKAALETSPGNCGVELRLTLEGGEEAQLALPQRVTPTDAVLSDLERIFGDTVVELS